MAKSKATGNNKMLGEEVFSGSYGTKKYRLEINSATLSKKYGKPQGLYTTLNCSLLFHTSESARKYIIKLITQILTDYLKKIKGTVLVVGLGNAFLVADSLGALVVRDILATHNAPPEIREGLGDVCALIPGVSGINGFETFEIVSSVARFIKPEVVVLVDTLTANSPTRLGCSFQFSDSGITPGAGIGNKNRRLDKNSLGCRVVSIGVPLMIRSDVIGFEDFIVTPKEIDIYTKNCAKIIARALNEALHGKEYKNFL